MIVARRVKQLRANRIAAIRETGKHLAFGGEGRGVSVGMRDDDVAVRQEAMSQRLVARGEPNRRGRHDGVAMQRDQAVHRAHELHRLAVRTLVAHDLRDRQFAERLVERPLQRVAQLGARRRVGVEKGLGLAIHCALQAGDRQVGKAHGGELLRQRRRRIAVGVEGDGDRQYLGNAVGERVAQTRQRLRRQFFGQQFDQQGALCGAHHAACVWVGAAGAFSIGKPSFSREA